MKTKILVLIMGVAAVLLVLSPASAHHGTAAYDTTKVVTVKGTMTDFLFFVNPQVQLYFEVKNDKGEVEKWQAELTAPNKMSRAGWDKHTLKPGDSTTASGYVTKNAAHTMWLTKLIGPDGEDLRLRED